MATKKLVRPNEGVVVAGVIAALARYFDQDPLLFRLVAVAVLLFTGIFPGLFLYLIAWFFIPRQSTIEYTVISNEHDGR